MCRFQVPGLLGDGTCPVLEFFYQADLNVGISIIEEYTMMFEVCAESRPLDCPWLQSGILDIRDMLVVDMDGKNQHLRQHPYPMCSYQYYTRTDLPTYRQENPPSERTRI